MLTPLMVVHNLDIFGSVIPTEHHPPLIVDANRVPPPERTLKHLKPVPGRHTQVIQPGRRIEILQFPLRHRSQVRGKPSCDAGMPVKEQVFRQLSTE
jgi:hypothetical protein